MILDLIKIERPADKPIFRQLVDQIIALVSQGVLLPGTRLPGSRTMAQRLGLHRKTVVSAMDELVAQGWLVTSPGRGTFISQQIEVEKIAPFASDIKDEGGPIEIRIPKLLVRPLHLVAEKYHLDDGLPDPRLAPVDELIRAYKSALKLGVRYPKYGYADPRGAYFIQRKFNRIFIPITRYTSQAKSDSGNKGCNAIS
ncbi:MAG: GntR family transcriptional regulator [Saprospiraceae bacterium]|nr:GntR family transcriptional regulator [Saprospiraceae bacterium]